jgi:hypothetical protein
MKSRPITPAVAAADAAAIVSRLPAAIAQAEKMLQAEQTDCRRLRT